MRKKQAILYKACVDHTEHDNAIEATRTYVRKLSDQLDLGDLIDYLEGLVRPHGDNLADLVMTLSAEISGRIVNAHERGEEW